MARKSALVVDDSKSARVILSRMLEKYDIEVDMAESAEQAIEYLKSNRPDAIFMDHLMPGMDGLQAVKAIKGNPQTAMIPIMMYTSQEGELYVGQARALGAMGVLPKQVRPVDVSKVLYELHLLPDRRDTAEAALHPVEVDSGIASERTPSRPAGSGPIDWGRRLETAVKDQAVDIRRFIVASLDSFSTRIISDVRNSMPIQGADPIAPLPPPPKSPWPWIAGILAACLVAVAFAASWVTTRNELTGVRAELAGLKSTNAELQRSRLDLGATVKDLTAALAANTTSQSGTPGAGAASGPGTRIEPVPYGEIAFDRSRLDTLRDMLTKLEAQGFHGTVKVTSSAGLFCLAGNATDGYAPAPPTLPVNRCDLVGNPLDEALSGQQRQSLAFANLVAAARQRTAGAITVALESTGTAHPSTAYPARTDAVTAGDWNKIAAANNRVEFSVEPSAAPSAPSQ
ncbi:MAG TPA: response regulator [Steroidobacteraceae bacterium]|jgi:CheY-like chemotaxis protein